MRRNSRTKRNPQRRKNCKKKTQLFHRMTAENPDDRPSLEDIKSDPWLKFQAIKEVGKFFSVRNIPCR
jgi:hypothetical protein